MKSTKLYVAIGLFLVFATACSNQVRVKYDYDTDVNLHNYKTYNWLPNKDIELKNNPLFYNELTDKRIKKAVDLQFRNKGIQLVTDTPDFLIHYHIIVDNKSSIRTVPYGYYYGPYWMRNQVDVYQYREGTLIIDLMDSKTNNLVWRGWGTSVIGNDGVNLTEEKINTAVYRILQEFPVKQN